MNLLKSPGVWAILIALSLSFYAGKYVDPVWAVDRIALDVHSDEQGQEYFISEGKHLPLVGVVPESESILWPYVGKKQTALPSEQIEIVSTQAEVDGEWTTLYYQLEPDRHWRYWSLLPAVTAILLCLLSREPITSLLAGIVSGAFILGQYDILEDVIVPQLSTESAAGVLVLYLWLLGGLLGIWSRNGAAQAFAELMTRKIVRGPRSAKLVTWFLGIIFFQGGTMSAVLVGSTIKPLADQERISHEELSYIVDSTASPIASLLAFNAWPAYVATFVYVAGVPWLATEADRIAFFFKSNVFCFYAIFAIIGTFLMSLDKAPFLSRQMKEAIRRSREDGELDAPGAEPLSAKELHQTDVPPGYKPHVIEFFLPLMLIIGIAIGTFIATGSPQVRWAFAIALVAAMLVSVIRGMSLRDLMHGFGTGIKGVVIGSVILLLAITIGSISAECGGGAYLVDLLGDKITYWMLPGSLLVLTMFIAFSTGSSWGTYAVTFPLAMPLTWAVSQANEMQHPQLFMLLCFAAVIDGSVYGDQCSPISDTTVLSAMSTGCDLMDHVKTQLYPATIAAILGMICWTLVALAFV